MPLKIIRQDITKMKVDAIVNPSNRNLSPDGGTDLSIHGAAGAELLRACETLGGCEVGKAKITSGFNLPCKYIIHTAGPNFYEVENSEELLISCYKDCLRLAKENGCESVAFPLISSGAYGFPKEAALRIATSVIGDFLSENEMDVRLVVYDKESFGISKKLFSAVQSFIDDKYVDEHARFGNNREAQSKCCSEFLRTNREVRFRMDDGYEVQDAEECLSAPTVCASKAQSLDDMLKNMDKSFSETLFMYIDEKGMTDVECYKKANIDRKLFSKIRSDRNYRPSKQTAIALAISLELTFAETEDFLKKAGFALSRSNKFDVIIEYFISNGIYNIFEINEALFAFDQSLLGA